MAIEDINTRLSTFAERAKPDLREIEQLRSAYEHIVSLRSAGHTVKAIWEDLREDGLQMTHAGFKSALRRIAMERGSRRTNAYSDMLGPVGAPSGAPHRWK